MKLLSKLHLLSLITPFSQYCNNISIDQRKKLSKVQKTGTSRLYAQNIDETHTERRRTLPLRFVASKTFVYMIEEVGNWVWYTIPTHTRQRIIKKCRFTHSPSQVEKRYRTTNEERLMLSNTEHCYRGWINCVKHVPAQWRNIVAAMADNRIKFSGTVNDAASRFPARIRMCCQETTAVITPPQQVVGWRNEWNSQHPRKEYNTHSQIQKQLHLIPARQSTWGCRSLLQIAWLLGLERLCKERFIYSQPSTSTEEVPWHSSHPKTSLLKFSSDERSKGTQSKLIHSHLSYWITPFPSPSSLFDIIQEKSVQPVQTTS